MKSEDKKIIIEANTLVAGDSIKVEIRGTLKNLDEEGKQPIKSFNDYAIKNGEMHPIAKLFYDAMVAVEKLGASEEQTDAVVKLGKCKNAIEDLLFRNDAYKLGRVDGFLQGYEESYIDWDKLWDLLMETRLHLTKEKVFNWFKNQLSGK